jgi:CRISPR-associated protein Cas1
MIKRTLYFGSNAYLHTKNKQLVIDFSDKEKLQATVPIEDIGVIILDAYQLTISHTLITKLLHNNVALISCDERHMPQGLMLNLDGNTIQQERFTIQIEASLPLKKQLWQQAIKAKIGNQRSLLLKISAFHLLEPSESLKATRMVTSQQSKLENMQHWQNSVRSGDPDNYEARAAAFYWKTIFSVSIENFKRGRFEPDPNHLLNYGYAILRAITARSLVASGLLPTLGIHHHNKYNAYALADDIMEPYRPYVDEIVRDLVIKYYPLIEDGGELELMPEIKKELLQIPAIDVFIDNDKSPLMIAMQRTTTSLFNCFAGLNKKILYPVL